MIRTAIIATLLMSLAAAEAMAQIHKPDARWNQVYIALNKGDGPLPLADRMAAADALGAFCEKFSLRIPRLSPREEDWLKSEIKARIGTAVETVEFARQMTGKLLDDCIENIKWVKAHQGRKSEAVHWALVARTMALRGLYVQLTRIRDGGVVQFSKDELEDADLAPSLASSIINRILIPAIELGSEWGK